MEADEKMGSDSPVATRQRRVPQDADRAKEMEEGDTQTKDTKPLGLLYTIEDTPPWYLCILLGFQVSILKKITFDNTRFHQSIVVNGIL